MAGPSIIKFLTEVSAKKGKGNPNFGKGRSALLKIVMPHLSGDDGDALAAAINNPNKFAALWEKASKKIINSLPDKTK